MLKSLKKKDDPEYSHKADMLMKKWKNIITKMSEKEDNTRNIAKHSGEKRSCDELNESISKKPKVNELNVKVQTNDNVFDALNNKNVAKSKKENTGNPSFVPIPTTPLEDILSIDSISSTNASFSKNFNPSYAYSKHESNNDDQVDDEDALGSILRARQSKRILYTGRKVNQNGAPFQVPKLFDLASRCLIDNLDDFHQRISSYSNLKNLNFTINPFKKTLNRWVLW